MVISELDFLALGGWFNAGAGNYLCDEIGGFMAEDDSENQDVGYPNFSKRSKLPEAERRFLIDEKFVEIHKHLNVMEEILKRIEKFLKELEEKAEKRDK